MSFKANYIIKKDPSKESNYLKKLAKEMSEDFDEKAINFIGGYYYQNRKQTTFYENPAEDPDYVEEPSLFYFR